MAEFVAVVLADTEDTWHGIFSQLGGQYKEPTLVLFTGRVNSACGSATAAVGPFYCPGDQQLYIDLSFFHDLKVRHGAPGDFAQAYVIAHEVGHHVQTLLGISSKVRAAGKGRSEAEVNALSVRQELQADCFAGLWGHAANIDRKLLDPGDLEEALQAATAIGDDRLQREAGRQVVPDSFTHGTSAQRVTWFNRGFTTGDFEACDTFSARNIDGRAGGNRQAMAKSLFNRLGVSACSLWHVCTVDQLIIRIWPLALSNAASRSAGAMPCRQAPGIAASRKGIGVSASAGLRRYS